MLNTKVNETSTNEKPSQTFISTLFTTFYTVFLAELGDKTQIATLLLSAESRKPTYVFLAASLALVLTSLLGVLLGRFISQNIPQNVFDWTAGGLMIIIGLWLLVQSLNLSIV